jgi:hypothetical protein
VLAIELRLPLGDTLTLLGEYTRPLALLREAEALAWACDDRVRLGRVLAQMVAVLRFTGDLDGAMAAGRQALALAAEIRESVLQGQASSTLGGYTMPSATSAGRPRCCGRASRRRTGSLARPAHRCGSSPRRG